MLGRRQEVDTMLGAGGGLVLTLDLGRIADPGFENSNIFLGLDSCVWTVGVEPEY
jgi:hypothetical protein